MDIRTNDVAGATVYWTLADGTSFDQVSAAMTAAGFGSLKPERMTDRAALKAALENYYPNCTVEAVKGLGTTFEVIRIRRAEIAAESATDNRNEYEHVLTAAYSEMTGLSVDLDDLALKINLRQRFDRFRQTIPYRNLSAALVEIVGALGGLTLRPTGGIYWIPNSKFDRWEKLAQAIELAGTGNHVYALKTIMDENSAAVMRQALTEEIDREARDISDIIATQGHRAARTARNRAADLRKKITFYETEFNVAMEDLKRTLAEATVTEAQASMIDSANAIRDTLSPAVVATIPTAAAGLFSLFQ